MTVLTRFMINGKEAEILTCKVTRNGTRTVDTAEFTVPPGYNINEDDEVTYIQDVADTTFLTAIYNFQYSARDEAGYDLDGNDGTYTADFTEDTTKDFTKNTKPVIRFDADGEKVTINDNTRFDFSKQFDIIIVTKPFTFPTGAMTIFSKSNGGIGGGIEIGITSGDPGYVDVELFDTSGVLTQLTGTNINLRNDNYHVIRVKRDSAGLIIVSVDGVTQASTTKNATTDNYTASGVNIFVGKNFGAGSKHYRGTVAQLRVYSGGTLNDDDFTKILYQKRQPLTMKFRGKVTRVENNVGVKRVTAESNSRILVNTRISKTNMDARNDTATNNGIDNIFLDDPTNRMRTDDIIKKIFAQIDSGILFTSNTSAGTIMTRFVARGTLIQIINNLFALDNRGFWITPRKVFIKENQPISTSHVLHSSDYYMNVDGRDTTFLINDLEAVGEVQIHSRTQTFSGDGTTKAFTLTSVPITTIVSVGGTAKVRGINAGDTGRDYYIEYTDGANSGAQLIFFTAPASGTNNISIEYTFENTDTLYFRNSDSTSISSFGRVSGRIYAPGFDQGQLATLVTNILNKRKNVNTRITIQAPKLLNFLREGMQITINYPLKNINTTFELKSIEWKYPDGVTVLNFGEHNFDYFDVVKGEVEKSSGLDDSVVKTNNI